MGFGQARIGLLARRLGYWGDQSKDAAPARNHTSI